MESIGSMRFDIVFEIIVNCGCGRKFKELDSASVHVMATGHKVTIAGTIQPKPSYLQKGEK